MSEDNKNQVDIEAIALNTMHGDFTKAMLEELEAAQDVWQKLPEKAQEDVIERLQAKAAKMIRQAVTLVANQGFESCRASVEQVVFKDGVKVVMQTRDNRGAHNLADLTNQSVVIIFADPDCYVNGGEMPAAEADQADLLEGENDENLGDKDDPLYTEAVAFVVREHKATISAVQRHLRIGYNRAARMIETMEANGVVSAMNDKGVREVLKKDFN